MKNNCIALLFFGLLLFGCKKDKVNTIPNANMEFFNQSKLDSMGTVDKLLGAWEWQYSLSGWTGEYSDEINKGLSLEFKADGTLLVNEDGQLVRTIT